MADAFAIEILELRKSYRSGLLRAPKLALADVTIRVKPGTIVGFAGANGAGKTTTIHALVGLLRPDSGVVRIFGQAVQNPAARTNIGFLGDHFHTYGTHTTRRSLTFHGELNGIKRDVLNKHLPSLLERMGLAGVSDQRVATLSKGMRTRVGLAQALLHDPRLLILDEPTSGLDPAGRRLVLDVLRERRSLGVTVFLSSHVLSDLERICDEVVIIRSGRIVATAQLPDDPRRHGSWAVEVPGWIDAYREKLTIPVEVRPDEQVVRLIVGDEAKDELLSHLSRIGVSIGEVRRHHSLEELYLQNQ